MTGVTATLAAAGLVPALVQAATATMDDPARVRFDEALVAGSAAVAAVVLGWLWLVATLVTLDAVRGTSRERRGVPHAVRHGVLVLCGVAITTGLAVPARANGGGPGPAVLDGLRLPERVGVSPASPPAPVASVVAPTRARRVLVEHGDTLWDIASEHLGGAAPAAQVAAYWPLMYAANRARIGPDPGLITPGQRLVMPEDDDVQR
jgi:hypothetical protein